MLLYVFSRRRNVIDLWRVVGHSQAGEIPHVALLSADPCGNDLDVSVNATGLRRSGGLPLRDSGRVVRSLKLVGEELQTGVRYPVIVHGAAGCAGSWPT